MLAMHEDMTERRRGGLAADVAHAARGPFSAALPALDMLLEGLLGEMTAAQRDALQTVARAVRRAYADSLGLATLLGVEVERLESHPAPCPVVDLLATAVETAAFDESVVVRTTTDPDLPAVLADRERTAAVLAVLLRRSSSLIELDGSGTAFRPADVTAPIVLQLRAERDTSQGAGLSVRVDCTAGCAVDASRESAVPRRAVEGAPASTSESAALLLARAVVEEGGGRLVLEGEAATVWLQAAAH